MSFYGDNTRWWFGRIVTLPANDPLKLGRAQVQIFGIHSEELDPKLLPWASIVLPTTSGGIDGIGMSPWLQANARVFGIFLDGEMSQIPLIIGTVPFKSGNMGNTGTGSSSSGSTGGTQSEYPTSNNYVNNTSGTRFVASSPEAKEAVEDRYGKTISNNEFDNFISLIHAECSAGNNPNSKEVAWIGQVVINRSLHDNYTLTQTIYKPGQFQPVTDPSDTAGRARFAAGPYGQSEREKAIYGALVNELQNAPTNMYFFLGTSYWNANRGNISWLRGQQAIQQGGTTFFCCNNYP